MAAKKRNTVTKTYNITKAYQKHKQHTNIQESRAMNHGRNIILVKSINIDLEKQVLTFLNMLSEGKYSRLRMPSDSFQACDV